MSYEERTGHPADFEVRYRILTAEIGGRCTGPPHQNYRCDWAYDGDDISKTGLYMIYPQFLAEDGSVFPEGRPVPVSGLATMWILSHQMRVEVHRERVRVGVRGYMMEGPRRVAEAVVTRVVGLHTNGGE
jgi:hypothetical protein